MCQNLNANNIFNKEMELRYLRFSHARTVSSLFISDYSPSFLLREKQNII